MKIKEPRHISLDPTNYFNLSSVGTAAVATRTVAMTSIREFVVKIKATLTRHGVPRHLNEIHILQWILLQTCQISQIPYRCALSGSIGIVLEAEIGQECDSFFYWQSHSSVSSVLGRIGISQSKIIFVLCQEILHYFIIVKYRLLALECLHRTVATKFCVDNGDRQNIKPCWAKLWRQQYLSLGCFKRIALR